MRTIYFDNNATTKVAPEVFESMKPFLTELYGNPSSMHTFGGQVEKHIRKSRDSLAELLGCEETEIIFTSGGTESDNAAIKGVLTALPEEKKIITTRIEHPAVLTVCRELQDTGYTLVELAVDGKGQIDLDELAAEVDDNTAIVSIMYANNETGVIFPIEKIAEIVKSKDAIFHTDAVQAVGKIPLSIDKSNIDL
ncbi:MAG: aminotransferase class V-fold PLP-dependent enzyme, partial [Phycisphaerae bacterium]|nr:aminotransferase class V-fold PLP-dependent enzyme [Phycisphaerae bacterium]